MYLGEICSQSSQLIPDSSTVFNARYAHNPLSLYQIVQQCLTSEMHLVQRAEGIGVDPSLAMANDTVYQIQQQLNLLKKSTQECGVEIEKTRQMQEHHSINFYKHHQISVQLDNGQFQEHSQEYIRWKEWRDKVATELRQSYNIFFVPVLYILCPGIIYSMSWCEDLAEIIWLNRQQIRQLEMIQEGLNIPSQESSMNILPELSDGLNLLLDSLVKSSFVIEKQPPQVLKTNTRFSATIRLLVGTKLNVHMSPPVVTASIISESQANSLLRAGHTKKNRSEYSSGDIVNNKQTMEYHQSFGQATGQLSVSFRNMSLKKIKRAEKKGTESVMDEKFALLFWSEFSIGNGEFHYQVCAPSLPVVVIVHGNQEPHAWATILWDNAFAEWGRQPFIVPEKVPWLQVANTLNMKFKASCGRGLTEENLKFLAGKAFSFRNLGYNSDCSNLMITWSQFCKEPLPDRSFTFWEWFYAVMKLTKEDLRGMWMDGALLGFVSRQQAEDYLQASEPGTFLIRFSDSELGGVTVAWMSLNEDTNQKEVSMLQPYTRKDLMIRSLADRIHDCHQMITLYPNHPKDQAIGKYYSSPPETVPRNPRNGYVPHHLVNVIPGSM
ncbi:signal transducer and activator of transcription 5B [Eurytemora carolleeae]|uniref:signal transducer and activator of transcription 5B n=1 Tax=Eurytemora carolleeae TaxID=1294199 RepID=UPI000C756F56|nr:signal transducer and activator of transcription 5B [Eurytemora carolleeae]|eukprot:XP_023331191.1 signal transducer and activator of transcription 5B-like [Eurytemora affinis]